MARTALDPQVLTAVGIAPTFADANADGHSIPGDTRTVVEVKNGSASSIDVTVRTPATAGDLLIEERIVAVPASTGDKIIGPFSAGLYNQADGSVYIDFSAVTTVTVACYKV